MPLSLIIGASVVGLAFVAIIALCALIAGARADAHIAELLDE